MSEIVVENKHKAAGANRLPIAPPPSFPLQATPPVRKAPMDTLAQGSFGEVSYEVRTSGNLTPNAIDKIIKILTLHKELYEDEERDVLNDYI